MINYASNIIPKKIVPTLTRLGKTDWAKIVLVEGDAQCAIQVNSYPEILGPMMEKSHDKLAVFTMSKWLAEGPKILRLTDLQCQALAETEVRIPPEDYRQPFPCYLVDLSPEFTGRHSSRPVAVLCYHQHPFLSFMMFSEGSKHDIISGMRLDLVPDLDAAIAQYHDSVTPEESDAATEALRIAVNASLLLVNYGHTVSPLLPVERASNERLARRGNVAAKERLGYDLMRVDFEQTTVVYDVQEERGGPRDGMHASPRPHWRRGHWRRQHHGKGLEQVKMVFIKPVLVKGIDQVISATYVRR